MLNPLFLEEEGGRLAATFLLFSGAGNPPGIHRLFPLISPGERPQDEAPMGEEIERTRDLRPQEVRAQTLLQKRILPALHSGATRDLALEFAAAFREGYDQSIEEGESPIPFGIALGAAYLELLGIEVSREDRGLIGRLVAIFGVGAFSGIEAATRRRLKGDWYPYAYVAAKGEAAKIAARRRL